MILIIYVLAFVFVAVGFAFGWVVRSSDVYWYRDAWLRCVSQLCDQAVEVAKLHATLAGQTKGETNDDEV
jgi:hypothetical protein